MDIHNEFKSGLWQSKIDVSDFVQMQIPFKNSADVYDMLENSEALTAIIEYLGGN